MARPLELSPTRLNLFKECPRCFWDTVHRLGPPSGPMSSLPSGMDLILKDYFDKYRPELPPLLKGKLNLKLVDSETIKKLRRRIKYKDPETGVVLWGMMDDCFVTPDGVLVAMDNKTRGFPLKAEPLDVYRLQLDTYAFLLQRNGYKTADYGYLVYYIPTKGELHKGVLFDVDLRKIRLDPGRVPMIFRQAIKVAKQPRPPRSHERCEFCEWLHRIERGRESRTP